MLPCAVRFPGGAALCAGICNYPLYSAVRLFPSLLSLPSVDSAERLDTTHLHIAGEVLGISAAAPLLSPAGRKYNQGETLWFNGGEQRNDKLPVGELLPDIQGERRTDNLKQHLIQTRSLCCIGKSLCGSVGGVG